MIDRPKESTTGRSPFEACDASRFSKSYQYYVTQTSYCVISHGPKKPSYLFRLRRPGTRPAIERCTTRLINRLPKKYSVFPLITKKSRRPSESIHRILTSVCVCVQETFHFCLIRTFFIFKYRKEKNSLYRSNQFSSQNTNIHIRFVNELYNHNLYLHFFIIRNVLCNKNLFLLRFFLFSMNLYCKQI